MKFQSSSMPGTLAELADSYGPVAIPRTVNPAEVLGLVTRDQAASAVDLGAAAELDASAAAEGGGELLLGRLDAQPVGVADVGQAALAEQSAQLAQLRGARAARGGRGAPGR